MNGIYMIRNIVNGKVYIGSTKRSFRSRWIDHKNLLSKSRHENKYLQKDWKEFGADAFVFEILEEGFTNFERETHFILMHAENCYNMTTPSRVTPSFKGSRLAVPEVKFIGEIVEQTHQAAPFPTPSTIPPQYKALIDSMLRHRLTHPELYAHLDAQAEPETRAEPAELEQVPA